MTNRNLELGTLGLLLLASLLAPVASYAPTTKAGGTHGKYAQTRATESGIIRAQAAGSPTPPNPTVAVGDIRGLSVGTHATQNTTATRKNFTLVSSDHNATSGGDYITERARENVNVTWKWRDYLYLEYNNTNMGQWVSGSLPGALKQNDNTNYTISAYNTSGDLHWVINASIALNISDYAGLTEAPLENLTINLRAKTTISTDTEHIMRIQGAEASDVDKVVDSTTEAVYNVTVSLGDGYVTDAGIVNITFKYDDSTDTDYSLKIDSLNVEPGYNSSLADYSYEPATTPINLTGVEFEGSSTSNYTVTGNNVSVDLGSGKFFYDPDGYDYNEWGIFSFTYQYNISVDSLDFRQYPDFVSVERESWTKDMDFTLNGSFSDLESMNWTLRITHRHMHRLTAPRLYNGTSGKWQPFASVDANMTSEGVIFANITNATSKSKKIRTTIEAVQMPTFQDERSGTVKWKRDERVQRGQRNRTYSVRNPGNITLENISWKTDIPMDSITAVAGGSKGGSLVIAGLGGGATRSVEMSYRATGAIIMKAKSKWVKRRLEGGSITVIGPGTKQYAKGSFKDGEFEARSLPPGTYDLHVTYTAWGQQYKSTFTIQIGYNEVKSRTLTYMAPPVWLVALIIATVVALASTVAYFLWQRKHRGRF